jgi:hypothetical protein
MVTSPEWALHILQDETGTPLVTAKVGSLFAQLMQKAA